MDFKDILTYAEENNLLIAWEQFNNYPENVPQKTIPLESVMFTSESHPNGADIVFEQIYTSKFLEKFLVELTKSNGKVKMTDYFHEFKVDAGMRDGHGWLCSGSGDGWSRYIHWDNLRAIPDFKFVKSEYYDEEYETKNEIEYKEKQILARDMERKKFNRIGTDEEKELINNHTDEELEKMIFGGRRLVCLNHLVKSIIRMKNGMTEQDAIDFPCEHGDNPHGEEDEYYRIEREEREAKERQDTEDELNNLKLNGTDDQKRIIGDSTVKDIEDKFPFVTPCTITGMVNALVLKEIGDPETIEHYWGNNEEDDGEPDL